MSDPSDDTIELRADPRDERAEEQEPRRARKPWIKGAVAAVVLVIFGAGTWYAYSIGMRTGSEGAAPLIRADQRPAKVKPDDPGGMNVPHQDKTIFDRVKPTDDSKKVEQLLPPPEEPVARPKKPPPQQAAAPTPSPSMAPAPSPVPSVAPAPETKAPAADAKTPPPPEPPTAAQLAAPPPLATTPTPAPQVAAPKSAETPKTAAASPAPTAATPAKNGSYKVQIASVPSQEQAEKEWAKAKAANSDLLGALTLSIQRADLGAKGIYYRVQAGPLADDVTAKTLCSSLQSRKIGCLVVRP
ncbi:MAG: SPOR domain-containing protein [Alphaproteobacteria bacterium]